MQSRQMGKAELAIRELAEFLTVDGEYCKKRQKLLRNYQLVDMSVELLRFRSKTRLAASLEGVFSALIGLLSAYLSGDSRKNELYMGRHMDFFIKLIDDSAGSIGLTATLLTVELFRNNRKLVDRVTFGHIDMICTLVKSHMTFRYLDLLSALCVCDGAALSRNQNYILQELFVKPRQRNQSVLPPHRPRSRHRASAQPGLCQLGPGQSLDDTPRLRHTPRRIQRLPLLQGAAPAFLQHLQRTQHRGRLRHDRTRRLHDLGAMLRLPH